jgi:hypothetical protein
MFDAHRGFQSCIFCGSTETRTKEHVLGKAFARRLNEAFGPLPNWVAQEEELHVQGTSPIVSISPPVACESCNTGALSRDMNRSLEPMWRLVNGEPHAVGQADRRSLLRYWERIGLIVDVMTSDFQIDAAFRATPEYARSEKHRQAPPLFSQEERTRWNEGGALPRARIYFGDHRGVLGIDPQTLIAPTYATDSQTPNSTSTGKRFLIVVGRLAVCVRLGDDARASMPESMCELNEGSGEWSWPRSRAVSYSDFFGLANLNQQILFAIFCMSNASIRREVEARTKATRRFRLPGAKM